MSSWIENTSFISVVGFRPQVRIRISVDQLRGDAHALAGAAHAAFQHGADAKLAGDIRNADFLALEIERRRARGHLQLRQLAQQVEDFLGDAVTEVFVLRVAAHVDERQHGDGSAVFVRSDPRLVGFDCRFRGVMGASRHGRTDVGYLSGWSSPLHTSRTEIEHPSHQEGDREAQHDQGNHQRDRPARQVEAGQHRGRHLDHHPSGNRIHDRDPDHATASQLGHETGDGGHTARFGHRRSQAIASTMARRMVASCRARNQRGFPWQRGFPASTAVPARSGTAGACASCCGTARPKRAAVL
ncbi:MAG: hypothetical protein ABIO58_00335 [Luteimonas sp.]